MAKIDRMALEQKINALDLDNESKSQLLELLRERKKYGIVWEEHPEDVEDRLRSELPVLVEDKDKAIISDDKDAPNHILIEGDNLEALTTLSYTHEGKIDVIYIDPPYNTGNKDFVYNDKFVDTEDQYRHSKWLSFMAKRLKIAKRLLSDKGVIFISIDDNEYADLKLLCDDSSIFGEEKHLATFKWNRVNKAPSLSYSVRTKYEYVLAYRKGANIARLYGKDSYNSAGPLYNISNLKHELSFAPSTIDCLFADGVYKKGTFGVGEKSVDLLDDLCVKNGVNANRIRINAKFKWVQETLDERVAAGQRFAFKKPNFTTMYYYLNIDGDKFIPPSDLISDEECGVKTNLDASDRLKEMGISFDYSKPISLIQYLLNMVCHFESSSTILDFFAGSGTTLHATMQLNAEDGGHRQCILVTNNENNICEEVTYERNKRVINGYTTPKGEAVEGLKNNTLRYYRTGFVARESSATAKRELMYAAADMLCIKNDIYTEQKQFGSLRFRRDVVRYFADGDKQMLVIYNPDAIETIVEEIKKMEIKTPIITYVFSLNDYAMDADFEDVAEKVSLCALPSAILNAYYKVLPKKERKEETL